MPGTTNSGGRNAKSTQFHLLTGTFRKDRHGAHETPHPPEGAPAPPVPLTGDAKAEWDRMVARLQQAKTISVVDDAALYQYVQLFAETEAIKREDAELRKQANRLLKLASRLNGLELLEAMDKIVSLQKLRAKHVTALRQGHMALRQYLVEFGMTPAARPRVKLPKATPEVDPKKARFLGGAHRNG